MQIRRATVEDAPACAAIVHRWLARTAWIVTPPTLAQLTGGLEAGIEAYQVWVAGDPVAGYLSFGPDEAMIRGFYTAAPGSGAGKQLLDHIKTGQARLQLWTHTPNTRAHAFYLREGFVFSGDERPGDDGPTERHMYWERTT